MDPTNPKRVYRLLGRSSAELNFDQFHATLIAKNDPHVIMSRIGAMRRLYYEEGECGYERVSPTSARIFVRGMATVTTPDCESTAGFYEVAITRSGGRDVDVRTTAGSTATPTAPSTAAGASDGARASTCVGMSSRLEFCSFGLESVGLASAGLVDFTSAGLASVGLASAGLASAGLASAGLASAPGLATAAPAAAACFATP